MIRSGPARISVSSSLLMATMNQTSSVRDNPQSASRVLTAHKLLALGGLSRWPLRFGPWGVYCQGRIDCLAPDPRPGRSAMGSNV